jgi:MoaA/NifB/PqqE/SkfB family radical SAM enzyme
MHPLLLYLTLFLNQAIKSPLALPGLLSRTKRFISASKNGEKKRLLMEKTHQVNIPFMCIFSVTWRCNLRCKACYALNYSVKEQLSLEEICATIAECRELGTYFFIIAGGEPLLVNGLLEKIATFKDAFFLFYTNGTLLEPHIPVLKKAHNILPVLSIEGEEQYMDSRRGEGVAVKVNKAMSLLAKSHIPFAFATMITHQNMPLVTSRKWLDQQWQRGARFGFYTDYIPFEKNKEDAFILTDEDRMLKEKALRQIKKEAKPSVFNLPPDEYDQGECMAAGKGMIHINADGNVEPCPYSHFAADNIRDSSIMEILQSDFFKELRATIKTLENPRKECLLFSHKKEVENIAKKTGAVWSEV